MDNHAVIKLMSEHRSIRAFKQQALSEDQIQTITTAARWASTSNHVQAYSIVVIRDQEKKKKLAELSGGQRWVEQCPVFFVICADYTRHEKASKKYGTTFDVGGAEQLLVGTVDAALLAQNMLLASEALGLGGVMIGGIRNNPESVCDLIGLPKYAFPVMGMAIGYPDQNIDQKPRLPTEVVVHHDHYSGDHVEAIANYDQLISDYYTKRTSGKRTLGWSEGMAAYTKERKRSHMDQFLINQGFLRN